MISMGEEHIDGKRALKGCSEGVYKAEDHGSKRERYSGVYRQLREVEIDESEGIDQHLLIMYFS